MLYFPIVIILSESRSYQPQGDLLNEEVYYFTCFCYYALFLPGVSFGQEVLTNDEVISLSKAGLSSSIIIDKIRTSKSNFDLTTDSLIKLKQSGISDDIVSAMLAAKNGGYIPAPAGTGPGFGFTPGKASPAIPTIRWRLTPTGYIFMRRKTVFGK